MSVSRRNNDDFNIDRTDMVFAKPKSNEKIITSTHVSETKLTQTHSEIWNLIIEHTFRIAASS